MPPALLNQLGRFNHQHLLTFPSKFLTLISSESPTLPSDLGSRLSDCKRIKISLLIEICQGVIDESMSSFVGSDGSYDIQERRG